MPTAFFGEGAFRPQNSPTTKAQTTFDCQKLANLCRLPLLGNFQNFNHVSNSLSLRSSPKKGKFKGLPGNDYL